MSFSAKHNLSRTSVSSGCTIYNAAETSEWVVQEKGILEIFSKEFFRETCDAKKRSRKVFSTAIMALEVRGGMEEFLYLKFQSSE